jgi:cell division protein FtsB
MRKDSALQVKEIDKLKEKVEKLERSLAEINKRKVTLEDENNDLESKVRNLDFERQDLTEKLARTEENFVLFR